MGAFLLALFIAILGYLQTKKMNEDRVNELIQKFNESKKAMASSFSNYLNDETELKFDEMRIHLTDYVNSIELFSKMILNQNLDKTKAFKQFQGDEMKCLCDAIKEVAYFSEFIYQFDYEKFLNVSVEIPARKNLRSSMCLLKRNTTIQEYKSVLETLKEHGFY